MATQMLPFFMPEDQIPEPFLPPHEVLEGLEEEGGWLVVHFYCIGSSIPGLVRFGQGLTPLAALEDAQASEPVNPTPQSLAADVANWGNHWRDAWVREYPVKNPCFDGTKIGWIDDGQYIPDPWRDDRWLDRIVANAKGS